MRVWELQSDDGKSINLNGFTLDHLGWALWVQISADADYLKMPDIDLISLSLPDTYTEKWEWQCMKPKKFYNRPYRQKKLSHDTHMHNNWYNDNIFVAAQKGQQNRK